MELQELDAAPQIQMQEFTQEQVEDLNLREATITTVAEAVHLLIKDLQEAVIAPIVLLLQEEVQAQDLLQLEAQAVLVEVLEPPEVLAEEVLPQEEVVAEVDRHLRTQYITLQVYICKVFL